jgi:SAM-dependent methyltransferase
MNYCPKCGSRAIAGNSCTSCSFSPPVLAGFEAYAPALAETAPGYNPEHYVSLAALEATNFWFQARNDLILWAFRKYFPEAKAYLEVGCGTGFVLGAIAEAFPGMEVQGSEIYVEGLGFAKSRVGKARLFQMDATQIPYREAFDVIGAFDVIEHIEDDVRVLEQMNLALRPGGGILLTVPQHQWLWSAQDDVAHHVRRYTREELCRKVEAAGFRVAWTSSFVSLLLPAMALSRFGKRDKAAPTDEDIFSEFRIPRWLNLSMLAVMRIEHALMRIGIRFPLGGSRILAAYKNPA